MKELTPSSEAELAATIAEAEAPFYLQGGGTRRAGRSAEGQVLRTTGLQGIELYEPGALTMVVKAGTPLDEVEAALAAEGQRLAFEPMDHRPLLGTDGTPTVGGMVAANVSGPRRIQAGACRDSLLGVRFVDGQGRVIRNGGRVMKNVTGYDLVKLMAGSRGTLGVLTEVALKVLPRPETQATLILHGLGPQDAVAAMSAALGSPYEVSGAAHIPLTANDDPDTLLRIEGSEASVAYRIGELKARLARMGEMSVVEGAVSQKAWEDLRDVKLFAEADGAVWRISARPGDAPGLMERIGDGARVQLDWGGGLIWALVTDGTDLRATLDRFDGHATLIRGQGPRIFHPQSAAVEALEAGLRSKFDPRGILNPGLMGEAA